MQTHAQLPQLNRSVIVLCLGLFVVEKVQNMSALPAPSFSTAKQETDFWNLTHTSETVGALHGLEVTRRNANRAKFRLCENPLKLEFSHRLDIQCSTCPTCKVMMEPHRGLNEEKGCTNPKNGLNSVLMNRIERLLAPPRSRSSSFSSPCASTWI